MTRRARRARRRQLLGGPALDAVRPRRRKGRALGAALLLAAGMVVGGYGHLGARPTDAAQEASPDPAMERGEYIARHAAMRVQCHSPRDAAGNLDETRLFRGATILVASPFRNDAWATWAPSLAGSGGLSDEDEIAVLTTGARLDGRRPLPPMPQFRLTPEDAAAVLAYLRSLAAYQG